MRHTPRLSAVAAALLLLTAFAQAPKPEAGFTSLFNGKDFTDWKLQNPGSFAIQDGAIVATGANGYGHAFYDGPFRNHAFQNFELKSRRHGSRQRERRDLRPHGVSGEGIPWRRGSRSR